MTDQKKKPAQIICPDCKDAIEIPAEVQANSILECLSCGAEAVILSIDPFEWELLLEEK